MRSIDRASIRTAVMAVLFWSTLVAAVWAATSGSWFAAAASAAAWAAVTIWIAAD